MIKINILTKSFVTANSFSFLGPLIKFKKIFNDMGVKINYFLMPMKIFMIVII